MRKKIILAVLIADFIIILIFIFLMIEAEKVLFEVRQALFAKISDSSEVFEITKQSAIERYSFIAEEKKLINEYSRIINKSVDYIKPEVATKLKQTRDIAKKAQFITLLYSKNGGPGGGGAKDLLHNIQRLNDENGMGDCTDHAEVFIALSHVYGLISRVVHHNRHTFNEVYDSSRKKWLWIDTQFAIVAKNDKGNYLSLLEMMSHMNNDKDIIYEFFGNSNHSFYASSPNKHPYYDDKEDFTYIMLTLGDNIFCQDRFNSKLKLLPKPIRQFIAIVLREQPKYIVYTTMMTDELRRRTLIRYVFIALSLFYGIINTLALSLFLINQIRQQRN